MKQNKEYYISKIRAMEVRESKSKTINEPVEVVKYLNSIALEDVEHFGVFLLDAKQSIISMEIITKGLLNRTLIHPREIFRKAIISNSASIILFHNHPSGNTNPSDEDINCTERLLKAGNIIGIQIMDHIIVSSDGYYSFKENGRI